MEPPQWAEALKEEIAPGVALRWRHSRPHRISGYYWQPKNGDPFISINCGTEVEMYRQRRVLIHEAAHHLVERRVEGNPSHREAYYRVLLPLYQEWLIIDDDLQRALEDEFQYKPSAYRFYEKLVAEGLLKEVSV